MKVRREPAQLAHAVREAARSHPGNEAAFRRVAEAALEQAAGALGVVLDIRVEVTLLRGRADAVFNRYVVEWEAPGTLSLKPEHSGNRHATDQLRGYLTALAQVEHHKLDRLAGAVCDGHVLIFARFRAGTWIVDEPVAVDDASAGELLEGLRAADAGKALTADNLLREFGPRTLRARQLAGALLDQLNAHLDRDPDGPAARLFRQWETNFAVATGVLGGASKLDRDAQQALAKVAGAAAARVDPGRALFALQTYFAILTKLIASLALGLYVPRAEWDLAEIATGDDDDLHEDIEHLEAGELFRRAGLLNAIEPDVFSWYVDWTPGVRDRVRSLIDDLHQYDPATLRVSPEDARDLLKDLYEGLLPRAVRHALGQYFTPDWLASLTLDRVEYHGDPGTRLVDPACGTGTFLVLAIARLLERLRRDGASKREALDEIVGQIVGFDLDPLAVVAARANYVLALGPLMDEATDGVDIPVYLADSVVTPAVGETLFTGDRLRLSTQAGTFELPEGIDTAEKLVAVCELASEALDEDHDEVWFVQSALSRCSLNSDARPVLQAFLSALSRLAVPHAPSVWPRILRNQFMPALMGSFDLVVGNPPWVNWQSLPEAYRERTRPIWERSGLFVHTGMSALLGAGKKDMAMLMSYVATERLLREHGRLGFVITQTVFKTTAGQGFRRFRLADGGAEISVRTVDDMVDLKPFRGAANRTAIVVWERDRTTQYPIRYVHWQRKIARTTIPRGVGLSRVMDDLTRRRPLSAAPVLAADRTSGWLAAPRELVPSLRKLAASEPSRYAAHAGVFAGADGIYRLTIEGEPDGHGRVPVTNLHDVGKTAIPKRHARVERSLLHPLIRGEDIQRWRVNLTDVSLLFVQDPSKRIGIAAERMKQEFPGALRYLSSFEAELRRRRGIPGLRRPDPKAATAAIPYWSMLGVGEYTLAKYKVLWKDQSDDFMAAPCVAEDLAPLPNHKVMLVACASAGEMHYLCGLLNSIPARTFINSYALPTQIATGVTRFVAIPEFDPMDAEHEALASAAENAAIAASAGRSVDSDAVDLAACRIWGINIEELERMRSFHSYLLKQDL